MDTKLTNEDGVFYNDYFDDTLWWVTPVHIKREPPKLSDGSSYEAYGEVIQLQWGWNAAQNQSQLDELDEEWKDAGFDHLTIEMDNAVQLYQNLGALLRKSGKIAPTPQLLKENRQLRQYVKLLIEQNPNPTASFQAIADMIYEEAAP